MLDVQGPKLGRGTKLNLTPKLISFWSLVIGTVFLRATFHELGARVVIDVGCERSHKEKKV